MKQWGPRKFANSRTGASAGARGRTGQGVPTPGPRVHAVGLVGRHSRGLDPRPRVRLQLGPSSLQFYPSHFAPSSRTVTSTLTAFAWGPQATPNGPDVPG